MSCTIDMRRLLAAAAASFALCAPTAHAAEQGRIQIIDIPPSVGVPYTWKARVEPGQRVEFVMMVGAKSWNDPINPEGSSGWTHMVNWVELELPEAARVKIRVVRQQGLLKPDASYTLARDRLFPAISIYAGDDHTTEHGHSFNQLGNFWADVEYVSHVSSTAERAKVVYKADLAAGKYTIAIGGNPPSLGDVGNYPPGNCNTTDLTCYTYNGDHGYRALITAR